MNPTVLTSAGLALLLGNLTQAAAGAAGHLLGATMSLFTNDVNPGKPAVIGDFTLATFTGSTPIAIASWGEMFYNENLDPEILGALAQWDYDSGTAETVYGIVLLSAGAGTPLLGYARLTTPKEMAATTDSLAIVPRFVMSADGFGSFSQLNA